MYGNRKQFERKWFNNKKEAIDAEIEFILADKSDYSKITFYELWTQYRDYKKIHLKAKSFRYVCFYDIVLAINEEI